MTTSFGYDAVGNVTSVIDPKAQQTVYVYDALSRLRSVTQHLTQQVSYDYDGRGRLVKLTNAREEALLHFYHPWGGLQRGARSRDNGEQSSDRKVSYTYDFNGNVRATVDTALETESRATVPRAS